MSLLKFRNGSKSLLRIRAIKGFLKVLTKKKNSVKTGEQLRNQMSVKFTTKRGDEE